MGIPQESKCLLLTNSRIYVKVIFITVPGEKCHYMRSRVRQLMIIKKARIEIRAVDQFKLCIEKS
jgi:hypothetical protein